VEFTVEPFVEGRPGRHVQAAIAAARRLGFDPEVGPFATAIEGDADEVLAALGPVSAAAMAAGAARVALAVTPAGPVETHPFLHAIGPVAVALHARVVPAADMAPGDIPLVYEGERLGGLRLPRTGGMLDRLIAAVEQELGGKLADLSREDKQRAVKLLDERGAFEIRRSTDDVADALGVSRITVYNYLNKL
jgi:uncharacterized protein YqgV (UPF0045/DUF77 family)